MKAFVGGAWKEVAGARAYVGGAWRIVTRKMAYIGGAWRQIASFTLPLSASATEANYFVRSPGAPYGVAYSTATPVGGIAPFTYAWTVFSVASGPSPTLANTAFATVSASIPGIGPGTSYEGVLKVVVSDASGLTAQAFSSYSFVNRYGDIPGEPF